MASLITLEGGDGTGKSTLLARIEGHLNSQGIPFVTTREPGGTPDAEEIREIILRKGKGSSKPIEPITELLLYEAARSEHVAKVIRPALSAGKHVLCDRFTYSSLAYQGEGRRLGIELVRNLNSVATGGLEPDIVIWLKLDPEAAKRRQANRGEGNRLDEEASDFHLRVFRAFERLARDEKDRFIVLDASDNPDGVFNQLLGSPLWTKHLGRKGGA